MAIDLHKLHEEFEIISLFSTQIVLHDSIIPTPVALRHDICQEEQAFRFVRQQGNMTMFCIFRAVCYGGPMQPRIIPRNEHGISRKDLSHNALRTLYRLHDHGFIAYLVGGCVRDLLIGRKPKDFDISTNATPSQVKRLFRNCRLVGRRFRLAHLYFQDEIIEVSTFRAAGPAEDAAPEEPEGQSRHHRHVRDEEGMVLRDNIFGTPEEDALRRDFTVNALAYNIADFSLIDYADGLHDLERRIIRTIGEPELRFTEDPVRMLRAARFAGSLGFSIEESTWDAMCEKSSSISRAAPARLFDETLKLFLLGSARNVLPLIDSSGLLSTMFPLFNQWLCANRERGTLLDSIVGRLDQMIGDDFPVSPHLLLAAIFGPCLEELALARHRNGMPRPQAIDASCAVFLEDICRTVRIPAKTGNLIRNILTFQHSLHKVPPRRPAALVSRSEFNDALSYLQIMSDLRNTGNASALWWSSFLADHPPETIDSVTPDDLPKKKRRKRRRHRKAQQ